MNHAHLGQSLLDTVNPRNEDQGRLPVKLMNYIVPVTIRTLLLYSIVISNAKWTRVYLFVWTVVRFIHGDKTRSLLDEPDLRVMFFSYFS
jgi:hypothetical protein